MPLLLLGQSRYWVANSTANWSSDSWSSSSGGSSDGLGPPTSGQTAVFNGSGIGSCNIDVAASLNSIQVLTGYTSIIDLNGYSFNLNGSGLSIFQDGTINDTPGTSSLNFDTTGAINFMGSNFNSSITGLANGIKFNGGVFNNLINVENKSNATAVATGTGGCVFNDNVIITNSGTADLYMGNGSPDIFNGDLKLINTGSGNMFIGGHSSGNSIAGNLVVNNYPTGSSGIIYLASSSASSLDISGNVEVYNNNGAATVNQTVYLAKDGDLTIGGNLLVENAMSGLAKSALVFLADGPNSSAIISGTTTIKNGGTKVKSQVYLGDEGDVTFNGTLNIENSSVAYFSEVFCYHRTNSSNIYNENIIVSSINANNAGVFFGSNNLGTGVLASNKTITIGLGGFVGRNLYVRNFTQSGGLAQNLTLNGKARLQLNNSDWGGNCLFTAPSFYSIDSRYRGTTVFTKTGMSEDFSTGGNQFDLDLDLNNTGSGIFSFGSTNSDTFGNDLTIVNSGAGKVYVAYNSPGNTIARDLIITNSGSGSYSNVQVCVRSLSTLTVGRNCNVMNMTSGSTGEVHIGNRGVSTVIEGNLTIDNIATGANGKIYLGHYKALNVNGNLTINNGGTVTNGFVYIGTKPSSTVSINGLSTVINTGAGNVRDVYLGTYGDVIFNNNLSISNSSSAVNSRIYCNNAGASSNIYNGNITVENTNIKSDGVYFGRGGGSGVLATTKTVSISTGGFIAGELFFKNFTQTGNTANSIILDSSGKAIFSNIDSDWGGDVVFSAPRMKTTGTTYRGTANLMKTGIGSDYSVGGNIFKDDLNLTNSGSGYIIIGAHVADDFQGDVNLNNIGTASDIIIAHSSLGNTIAGNLTATNSTTGASGNIIVSSAPSSETSIIGNVTLLNNGTANSNIITLGSSGKISSIGGNLEATNNTTGVNGAIYLVSSDTLSLTGNLEINNIGASNNEHVYIANTINSFATIGGTTQVLNSGTGTVSRVYLGYSGSAIFNGDVKLSNNSSSTSSQIYSNYYSSSNNIYNGNIIVESYDTNSGGILFGYGNGLATLAANKTVTVGANGFIAGQLMFKNFTQLGSSSVQTINLLSTGTGYFTNYNSDWRGNVSFSAPRMVTRGTTYGGTTYLEKTGSYSDQSYGANVYNGDVTFKNSGTGYFMPTNNNASDHNGNVTYIKTGTGLIYPTYSATSTYAGDINIDFNTPVSFGAGSYGRVLMDGTTAQSINDIGTSPKPNFRRLTTNNLTHEITLNTPINIQNQLNLLAGNIISDATNYITMRDNSTVFNASDNAFVDGPLQKSGNDPFTFPVGKNGVYRPIEISAPPSSLAQFKGEFFPSDPHLSGYNHGFKDATLDHISNCEYWILDRTNTFNGVNVKLYYDSYGTSSCSGVDNQSELAVARWDGSMWKDHGNGSWGGTTADGWVETSGFVTSFSPFTLASTTTNNPLPIELVSFSAIENNDVVDLFWETASEIDNDYFTVERSNDGINYEAIEKIIGAGNSAQNIEYSTVDEKPLNGVSYYRLKQKDFNGDFTYSDIEVVNFSKADEIVIYPNPVQDVLTIEGLAFDDVISVYGVEGKLIYKGITSKFSVGEYSNGVYQLVVSHKNGTQEYLKFIK